MRISFEGKLGILLGLVFGAGSGAVIRFPADTWLGWTLMAIAGLGGLLLSAHSLHEIFSNRSHPRRKARMLLFSAAVVCAFGTAIFTVAYLVTSERGATEAGPDLKARKIAAARRWIKLSNEIFVEITSDLRPPMPSLDRSLPPDAQRRMWEQSTQRLVQHYANETARRNARFASRIKQAELEVKEFGLLFDGYPLDEPIMNDFGWSAWASALGGLGNKVLIDNGVTD